MRLRTDFLNWRPDAEDFSTEGLVIADNVIHDTEGYKPIARQTTGAFNTLNYYAATPLASVRAMQVRSIGDRKNNIAAMAVDKATSVAMAELSVGAQGDAAPFTTVSTGTLTAATSVRIKSFSVAELGEGAFVFTACFQTEASGVSGSTLTNISGDVTYSVLSV